MDREVPADTKHIGYRAHYFEPVWGKREDNCIPFDLIRADMMPFEKNYYLRPSNQAGSDDLICWFAQNDVQAVIDEKGYPDFLRLKEDAILLLQ